MSPRDPLRYYLDSRRRRLKVEAARLAVGLAAGLLASANCLLGLGSLLALYAATLPLASRLLGGYRPLTGLVPSLAAWFLGLVIGSSYLS